MRVGEQLDLDVSRTLDVPLAEHGVVTERRHRLAACGRHRLLELVVSRTTRIPRPPPPAAAFTTRGKPISSGSPVGTTGTPAAAAPRLARELVAAGAHRPGAARPT